MKTVCVLAGSQWAVPEVQIKTYRPLVAPHENQWHTMIMFRRNWHKGLWMVWIQFCILTGEITECWILVPMEQLTGISGQWRSSPGGTGNCEICFWYEGTSSSPFLGSWGVLAANRFSVATLVQVAGHEKIQITNFLSCFFFFPSYCSLCHDLFVFGSRGLLPQLHCRRVVHPWHYEP